MQPVDFTTLTALCQDLRSHWIPARLEQVYQRDRYTINLALRTLKKRAWLTVCWHPQAARICIGDAPPRSPDTFTFSDQLRHQLNGLALVEIAAIAPWERVLDLQFAKRPGDEIIWHLYIEIMSKYSNVILTGNDQVIVTVAHQVSSQQSSVRPLQTGDLYELPPKLTNTIPSINETQERWQERISLIPGKLSKQILKNYRGLSPALVNSLIEYAELDIEITTDNLTHEQWENLFIFWQKWINHVTNIDENTQNKFLGGFTKTGYNVIGWGIIKPTENLQTLLNQYYTKQLNQQEFNQLYHQISQKIGSVLGKLQQKATGFNNKLKQSEGADIYKEQADLLMAYLHEWELGMNQITLIDFHSNQPVTIPLEPDKNAVQNAQSFYKKHQKLKRARIVVEPLLKEVEAEIFYLQQIETNLTQIGEEHNSEDLLTLTEIKNELIQQGYIENPAQRPINESEISSPHRYISPSGFELLIGRNNKQNDQLSFRIAGDYDLWFHTQEIPGSHCLLRIPPGQIAEEIDLQFAADLSAYYSQGRQSEQVPVVYTKPKYVYKPKGAKPGMVVYKQEKILWGYSFRGKEYQHN
jgi:predicted ribosome quality control (RQC) complex YloA/Tae2 family protein